MIKVIHTNIQYR